MAWAAIPSLGILWGAYVHSAAFKELPENRKESQLEKELLVRAGNEPDWYEWSLEARREGTHTDSSNAVPGHRQKH